MKSIRPLCLLTLALPGMSLAATFNWSGATSGNWATSTNWDAAPVSATTTALSFDNAIQLTMSNDIAGGLTLNSLTLTANSGARTLSGNKLTFDGSTPSLTMQNATGTGDTIISAPLQVNQTLAVAGGVDFAHQLLLTGVISGSGGLTWSSGVGALSGNNTYTGATLIAAGGGPAVLHNNAFGVSSGVTVDSGGDIQMRTSIVVNRPLTISGTGFTGDGALHGSDGSPSWTGNVTLAAPASIGAFSSGTLSLNGQILAGAHTLTVQGPTGSTVNLGLLTGTSSTTNGKLTGTGGLTKTGAGTLVIGGFTTVLNTFSGPAQISQGRVVAKKNTAFGATPGVTVAAGAVVELLEGVERISLGQPIVRSTVIDRPLTLGGSLIGSPGSWTGNITLSCPAQFSANGSGLTSGLQVSAVNLNGQTLTSHALAGRVTFNGPITGSGALVLDGTNLLNGGQASSFTGPVSVSGHLLHGSGDQLGNSANAVAFAADSFFEFDNIVTIGPRPWWLNGRLIVVPHNFPGTIGAAISGPGPLEVTGISIGQGGPVTLTGQNTFTGGLVIATQCSVTYSTDDNLGEAGQPIRLDGGTLVSSVTQTLSPARSLTLTGLSNVLAAPAGVTFIVPQNITSSGSTGLLRLGGGSGGGLGGSVVLSGTNTHAGGTEISGETLEIFSDANIGAPAGVLNIGQENGFNDLPGRLLARANLNIAATRSTAFRLATVDTNGFDVTFHQPITGLDLTKDGAGVLRLNTKNANDSLHSVFLNAGTLRIGANDALGLGARVNTTAGAAFDLNGFDHELVNVNGDGDIALGAGTLTTRGTSSIGGVISGTGGVVLNFDGGRLLGENTFTGGITVRDGAGVSVKTTAGFGGAGNAVVLDNGGIFADFEAPGPVVIGAAFPMTIAAGGARFGANGQPLIIEALLAGANPLRVQGGGPGYEVRFAHAANTFTGNIQLGDSGNSGFGSAVLGIVADGSLGNAANIVTLGDSFFDGESTRVSQGTLRAFGNLTLPATRALRLNGSTNGFNDMGGVVDTNGFDVTIAGGIAELSPEMPLLKTGAGTLFLNGVSSFTGGTTVSEGTLGGTGTIGAVAVQSGATLAPGSSPGTLHTGDVTFDDGATLALDFASPVLADQLAVTGSVSLNGNVALAPALGYVPAATDTFIVIANDHSDPVAGGGLFTFNGAPLAEDATFASGGASWRISYTGGDGNDVTLTVQASAPASAFDFTSFTFDPPSGGAAGIQITAAITGPASTLVNLEASSDLVAWTVIGNATTSGSGVASFDITDTGATGSRRYYRTVPP